MDACIVGSGMVSASGLTPREHAFFVRALMPPPIGSPFWGPRDKPIPTALCPLLGSEMVVGERLTALATRAVKEALQPIVDHADLRHVLLLCTGRPRPGLSETDVRNLQIALERLLKAERTVLAPGAAGVFHSLSEAAELLAEQPDRAVVAVAVDSFISMDWLTHQVRHPPSHWTRWPPMASEGAGALLLMPRRQARKRGVAVQAAIEAAACHNSASHDENDEAVDGAAMTHLVRTLCPAPVHHVFGQGAVDDLRSRAWQLGMGRNAERFRAGHEEICLEASIGSLGAASGVMSAAYALACLRHHTLVSQWPTDGPFLVWAISRNGTRGMARIRPEAA